MIPCSLSLARRLTGGLLCLIGLLPLAAQATLNDGVNGNVYAVAHGADGTTYVGGAVSAAGATTGGFGALNTTDGTVNRAFPQVVGTVEVSVADGAGGWFIWLIPGTHAAEAGDAAGWQVRLRVEMTPPTLLTLLLSRRTSAASLGPEPGDR